MPYKLVTREDWGAEAPRRRLSVKTENMLGIVAHHTVTDDEVEKVVQAIKSIQRFHLHGQGWWDVAYNWIISRDGRVWEARGEGVRQGATAANRKKFGSSQYANKKYYAVAFLGNYEEDTLTPFAINAFRQLREDLMSRGMGAEIRHHREFKVDDSCIAGTLCPGKNVVSAREQLLGPDNTEEEDWRRVHELASKYVPGRVDSIRAIASKYVS